MPHHKDSIFVIDDDTFTLKLTARMLANSGYSAVSVFDNVLTALQQLDSLAPELILLDVDMPGINAAELVQQLSSHHYRGSLFLLSDDECQASHSLEKLAAQQGIKVMGCLPKPVASEKLVALLAQWGNFRASASTATSYSADELRSAIVNGEFFNYFQPKVAPATGKLVGVETLLRWQHPVNGVVFPRDFIRLAEVHGLIDDLSRVVLKAAFAQARAWQADGLALQLAVNISIDNLASTDFADFAEQLASENGLSPRNIVLEVSESRIPMNDLSVALETLTRLRMKRFRLSIDEFGTGHSSLAQMHDIPFDEIKIGRSFVHGASIDKSVQAKYDASLAIAKQLDMEVVAVGVEDRDDWDNLRHTGCQYAQGYFIAKPMPAEEVPGWIKTWHGRMGN